jgi:hypothetical protein
MMDKFCVRNCTERDTLAVQNRELGLVVAILTSLK